MDAALIIAQNIEYMLIIMSDGKEIKMLQDYIRLRSGPAPVEPVHSDFNAVF
jgi:hypothetical protein